MKDTSSALVGLLAMEMAVVIGWFYLIYRTLMRYTYRIIGRLTPSTGSIYAGQVAQHAPDRWLKPHRTGGSAASEYS